MQFLFATSEDSSCMPTRRKRQLRYWLAVLFCWWVGWTVLPASTQVAAGGGVARLIALDACLHCYQQGSSEQRADQADGTEAAESEGNKKEGNDSQSVELDEIARQGIPRPTLEAVKLLRSARKLVSDADVPSGQELRAFRNRLVSPAPLTNADRELIRRCTRYYVLRLSDPAEFGRRRRNLQELADILRRARGHEQVYDEVRRTVIESAGAMFKHHIVSRVSAGIVLFFLADEEALPLLVQQIADPQQHESVKIWCIKAIAATALRDPALRIKNKQYEEQALRALLDYFRSTPPPHYWTQREIILALGAIGRPTEDLLGGDANVAREIVLFLRGENLRAREGTVPEGPGRLVRVEAVNALVLLLIPDNLDYNFQQIGAEVARFSVEAAYSALRDPLIDRLHSYLYVQRCYESLVALAGDPSASDPNRREGVVGRHPLARQQGDPAYLAELRDRVKKLSEAMIEVYRQGADGSQDLAERTRLLQDHLKRSNVEALATAVLQYIEQNQPRNFGRLTPATAPLPPWRELTPPSAQTKTATSERDSTGSEGQTGSP